MKLNTFTALAICISSITLAQSNYKYGNKFDFDATQEKDVKLIAGGTDTYYMQSSINENSIRSNNKILVRKFDNSNNLKQTFSYEIPQIEKYAPINYLGSFESGNKIVFITETYAGKVKKKDIYKIIFDKTTGTFTNELLASYPIESTMKSGTAYFEKSENGRYGAVVFYQHAPRKEPVKISINVIDTGSLKSTWTKEVTGEAGSSDTDFFVTNSGNIGLLRSANQNASLLFVTASGQEEKFFTEKMKVISETAVSIGDKDYLVAFNSTPKTIKFNASNFENLMLYDIKEGKIIANEVVKQYNDGSKIADLFIPYTYINGDKIYIFTESKLDVGTKQVKSPMGTMMITETSYKAGDPRMVAINTVTGKVESIARLNSDSLSDLEVHSLGLVNIKGNYILKAGSLLTISAINFDSNSVIPTLAKANGKDPYFGGGQAYNQALLYRPEVKSLAYLRALDKQASIITVENFEGK